VTHSTIATLSRIPGRTINDATVLTGYGRLREMIDQGHSLAVDASSYESGASDVECLVQMLRAAWTAMVTKLKPDPQTLLSVIADLEASVQEATGPEGTEYVDALVRSQIARESHSRPDDEAETS